jgi:hypothetical protein
MYIEEVVEPAVDAFHLAVGVAAKGTSHAIFGILSLNPFSFGANAHGREAKAGDTRASAGLVSLAGVVLRITVNQVSANTRLTVHSVLKKPKATLRQLVQQRIIVVTSSECETALTSANQRCTSGRLKKFAPAQEFVSDVQHPSQFSQLTEPGSDCP